MKFTLARVEDLLTLRRQYQKVLQPDYSHITAGRKANDASMHKRVKTRAMRGTGAPGKQEEKGAKAGWWKGWCKGSVDL